jgi:hypothetical protein
LIRMGSCVLSQDEEYMPNRALLQSIQPQRQTPPLPT